MEYYVPHARFPAIFGGENMTDRTVEWKCYSTPSDPVVTK